MKTTLISAVKAVAAIVIVGLLVSSVPAFAQRPLSIRDLPMGESAYVKPVIYLGWDNYNYVWVHDPIYPNLDPDQNPGACAKITHTYSQEFAMDDYLVEVGDGCVKVFKGFASWDEFSAAFAAGDICLDWSGFGSTQEEDEAFHDEMSAMGATEGGPLGHVQGEEQEGPEGAAPDSTTANDDGNF